MAGHPTRRGSKTTAEDAVAEDAPPVARLREAGAVFLGKTTTPEFGWKGVTDSPLTGIPRNPWVSHPDPGRLERRRRRRGSGWSGDAGAGR